jgi:hypothetical protein
LQGTNELISFKRPRNAKRRTGSSTRTMANEYGIEEMRSSIFRK